MKRSNPVARVCAKTLVLAAGLSLPLPALAQTAETAELLEIKPRAASSLTVEQLLTLSNLATPDATMTCQDIGSDNCKRRVTIKIDEITEAELDAYPRGEPRRAYRLLAAWAEQNEEQITAAQTATERRQERRSAAAAENAEAAEVEEETVTEETSRSSSQDQAESGDSSRKLLTALGIVGAAAVAGSLLNNGDEVVEQQGDRLVVRRDGELVVRKDENELMRRPGSDVRTSRFDDGSTRTVVTQPNGNQIETIRDAQGDTIRRSRLLKDGRVVVLFDDTEADVVPVDNARLANRRAETVDYTNADAAALRRALRAEEAGITRSYSLRQVRNNVRVRNQVPQIDLDGITFATGSAAIRPNEAQDLFQLGNTIRSFIDERPGEVFLIEGHTDAVGGDVYNLALSDRRAESVALALTEYFDVPPENLVVQGYGERFLKVDTQDSARQNRRAVVRRITPLLNVR